MVHQVQKEIITDLSYVFPNLTMLLIFLVGVQAIVKTKNQYNLCHRKSDYNINGKWLFFTTSHGKQPCKGIGGSIV